MKKTILLVLMLMMFCLGVMAFSGKSVTLTQYNGDKIEAYYVEDNGFNYYEDKDGYIIVKKDDTYYYGTFESNEIIITENIVGECDPIFLDLNKYEKSKGVIPGFEETSFELLSAGASSVKTPNGGNITPIVLLCGRNVDNEDPEWLPSDIFTNYDEYWNNTNNLIKVNEMCYNEEGTFYRQSINSTLRLGEQGVDKYVSDPTATIEVFKDRIVEKIKGNEDIYDINGDGYVDAVIIVTTKVSAKEKGYSTDLSGSGVNLSNLKLGMCYLVSPEYFREAKYFAPMISKMLGFDIVKPYGSKIYANVYTPKYGDTAVSDDAKSYVLNKKYEKNISTLVKYMSRGKVSFTGSYINKNDDWECEDVELAGFDANSLQTMFDTATFNGMTSDTNILDVNEDGYVDLIVLVTASDRLEFKDYSDSNITYRNTGLFVGKVLIISESKLINDSIDAAAQIVKGLNYRSLQRSADDYKPGYMLDFFGNSGDYDFVVPSVYAQRQGGYIITEEECEEEEAINYDGFESTGILTINKETSKDGSRVYKIFPSTETPSEKQTIAYKIISDYNSNEEFWVEYRKPIKSIENIILDKEPNAGLYIYRVNKTSLGRGNNGSGQTGNYYIPDEIYYYREGGSPDYGYSEGLNLLNGDVKTANIGVVGRKTFDYSSDPRAFFSNDLVDVDFQVYDVTFDSKSKFATFKVKYGLSSPKVDGVNPIGVNVEADSSVFKEFRASYSYDVGAVNLNNLGIYWGSGATYSNDENSETYENYLTLIYNNYFNQVTMKKCKLVLDEGEERTFTDQTFKLGESQENGNDIIIYNERFKLNVTKSYAKYIDNKLVLFYYIAPTEKFIEKIDNTLILDPYTDGEKIYVHQSANTVDGKKAVDKFNNDIITIGMFGWTLKTSTITFDSLSPETIINVDNHDYFFENVTVKGSYNIEEEEPTEEEPEPLLPKEYINHQGFIYQNYSSNSALVFDYYPNIVTDYEGEFKKTYESYNIKVKYKINKISGFLGAYTEDINSGVKNPVLAITDIDFEILECDPATILGFIDVKEYIEEEIAKDPSKLFNMVKGKIPYENVIDWHNKDDLQNADPMVLGNGFVKVEASTFKEKEVGNKSIQYSFSINFDKDKMKETFGVNLDNNQVYFNTYGFSSLQETLEDVFNDIQKKRIGKNTDYKYIGYVGVGGNDEEVQPVVNSVEITPEPEVNPFITSKILPFDENIAIKVNYSQAISGENTIDASDIMFKFVKPSGEDAIVIRYNPVTRIFYSYDSIKKQWITSDFDVDHNIQVGEFTIPCKSYSYPTYNEEDDSYDFTFYLRSKSRFSDGPLTLEAVVTDERGYASDTFYGDTTYIFRKASSNVVPTIESISPCKGSIKANTATDFVLSVSDQDSYYDINNVVLNFNCGPVNEFFVKYNYQENTIQILQEDGSYTDEYILGSNTEDLVFNNFSLDVRNSYTKVINSDKIELHLSITPLSALSGNSVKVRGYVDDIYWTEEKIEDYVTKTYGYITITTIDPDEIILNKSSVKLGVSESCSIKVVNSNGDEVKAVWTSKNANIATVTNGKIVGVKAGSTTVVANVNGKSLKCSVTVTNPDVKAGGKSGEVVDQTITNNSNIDSSVNNKTGLSNIKGLSEALQKVIKNNK